VVVAMSEALSTRDLRAMLDLVGDGYDDDPGEGLPDAAIRGLMRLVPCDAVCLFELEPAHRRCEGEGCVHEPGLSPVFWEHYWNCPPCSYPERSGDAATVTKTSDFYTRRQWHSAPMYTEYLRHFGVEDEIVACLPAPPGRSVRLLLRRASGSFGERDRLLVALLRPHLHGLYRDRKRRAGIPELTARQWELLRLVAAGHSNTDIARQLFLSPNTVRKHLENIYQRLDVSSRTAAVARAFPPAQIA
jgi:DNA-binding CsgD family transcriptional regulator